MDPEAEQASKRRKLENGAEVTQTATQNGDANGADAPAGASGPPHPPQAPGEEAPQTQEDQERMLEEMDRIEAEYNDLKDKLYEEKVAALRKELQSVKYGQQREFRAQLKEYERIKQEKIAAADQWRQYQLICINNAFDQDRRAADDEYRAEKENIREKLLNVVLEKQRKIEDEMNAISLREAHSEFDHRAVTRKLRRRAGEGGASATQAMNVRKRLSLPSVQYFLSEEQVNEDLEAIRAVSETVAKQKARA